MVRLTAKQEKNLVKRFKRLNIRTNDLKVNDLSWTQRHSGLIEEAIVTMQMAILQRQVGLAFYMNPYLVDMFEQRVRSQVKTWISLSGRAA
jgi:hypothetical protein